MFFVDSYLPQFHQLLLFTDVSRVTVVPLTRSSFQENVFCKQFQELVLLLSGLIHYPRVIEMSSNALKESESLLLHRTHQSDSIVIILLIRKWMCSNSK